MSYWYKVNEPIDGKGLFKLGNSIWVCTGAMVQQGKVMKGCFAAKLNKQPACIRSMVFEQKD